MLLPLLDIIYELHYNDFIGCTTKNMIRGDFKMDKPIIAGTEPIHVNVKAGETYYWCSCGRSSSQPFCDGSHKGTSFKSLVFTAEKNGDIAFCSCKLTSNPPFCDGTHISLKK